jgi:hypothetical protein
LFFDRTIVHRMTVTYGVNGSIEYSATPFDSPESTLLSYISRGRDTGDEGSVKVSLEWIWNLRELSSKLTLPLLNRSSGPIV